MDEREQISIIESILFMAGEPVTLKEIADLFDISVQNARNLMESAARCFDFERRGLQILCLGDNYQLVTRTEYAPWIDRFTGVDRRKQLPSSLLETIAVIAYKQPVTRSEVEYIRGVKCDYSMKKLQELGLIEQAGRKDVPGKPFLYATTPKFLKTFGLSSLEELPVVQIPNEEEGDDNALTPTPNNLQDLEETNQPEEIQ